MANCPNCQAELPVPRPETCPSCDSKLSTPQQPVTNPIMSRILKIVMICIPLTALFWVLEGYFEFDVPDTLVNAVNAGSALFVVYLIYIIYAIIKGQPSE